MCQTLLNELKVTADILLIWPWHEQLGAHCDREKNGLCIHILNHEMMLLPLSHIVLGGLWTCFSLAATFCTHLYPWHGWTARGCRPQRWAWRESLRHREVGCGSGSPLRPTLCLRRFLWPQQGKQLSLAKSVLHWEDCRLLWVWWWSAAALEGHFVGCPLPKYPAMTR